MKSKSNHFEKKIHSNLKSKLKSNLLLDKFLFTFGILTILYYSFSSLGYLDKLTYFLAQIGVIISSVFIKYFYPELEIWDNVLILNGFRVNVGAGCDGLEVISLFLIAVVAFPSSFKLKIPAIIFGSLLLFLINLLRIIGLFFIGYHNNEKLDFFHHDVFPLAFIIIEFVMWYSWIKWTKANG